MSGTYNLVFSLIPLGPLNFKLNVDDGYSGKLGSVGDLVFFFFVGSSGHLSDLPPSTHFMGNCGRNGGGFGFLSSRLSFVSEWLHIQRFGWRWS